MGDYTEKRTGTFGLDVPIGPIGSANATYTHEYQRKYNELYTRGFGIKASLKGDPFDVVIWKQDKYASADGYVESASTGNIGAARPGVDNHICRGSQ